MTKIRHADTPRAALLMTLAGAGALVLSGCHSDNAESSSTFTYDEPEPLPALAAEETADAGGEQFFDPFAIDASIERESAAATQAPVFAAQPPSGTPERTRVDAAVGLYGETAGEPRGSAGSNPETTMVLDGMEGLTQVTFAGEGADFDPMVSRNGKSLVFASTQHRPTADIYIKQIDGRAVTQLTADPAHDVMPSISPDGSRIAFASNRSGSWDIYLMSSEGGQAVQITSDPSQELHPTWSPDGTKLAYCRLGERSGRWELWVLDVNRPVSSEFIGYGLFPEWSPVAATGGNGRDKILFQRSRERGDRAFSVWTLEYSEGDASSPTEIASSQIAAIINPTWSADGRWICFATVPYPSESAGMDARPESADLWLVAADGSGRVNMTVGRYINLMPTFSPDGRVFFVSDRSGVDNIWSINTNKAQVAARGTGGGATYASEPTEPNANTP